MIRRNAARHGRDLGPRLVRIAVPAGTEVGLKNERSVIVRTQSTTTLGGMRLRAHILLGFGAVLVREAMAFFNLGRQG